MTYTVKEAAAILRTCERTIRNWLNDGTMKGFKPKGQWRITSEELERIKGGK